jgi:RNA polymerase sigma factor (sigma-70 family)
MATRTSNATGRDIRSLFVTGVVGTLSDSQLLDRFLSSTREGAEAAFSALVERHGPMVMGVCRRVLSDANDADDAFQATFLVLVRKARSIARRDLLANWLYGVAVRTARVARARTIRRRAKEGEVLDGLQAGAAADDSSRELPSLLDEELSRLPEKYRLPVVLCELNGQSRKEAAHQLGLPEGTLSSRLARARLLLRDRLARRGIALTAGSLAAVLSRDATAAAVRPALAKTTVQIALHYAAGGAVSMSIAALTEGVLKTMLVSKLKAGVVALLASCVLAGIVASARGWPTAPPPPAPKVTTVVKNNALVAPRDEPKNRTGEVEAHGTVVGPDGKPVAGAEISVWWYAIIPQGWHHHDYPIAQPKVIATSGPDGKFRTTIPKSLFANAFSTTQTQTPWTWAEVVASAEGYGPAFAGVRDDGKENGYELKLVADDVPVRGRVIDLQGRPVAGVRIRVQHIEDEARRIMWQPTWKGLTNGLTTDNDGRFLLRGFGRDRNVLLHVNGPTIEHKLVGVSTRKFVNGKPVDHADVEVVAGPCKPIEGVVRAKDSSKPLAGAWVYGGDFGGTVNGDNLRGIRTITDVEGKFRLEGMSKADRYHLTIFPRNDQPYVMTETILAGSQGLEPIRTEVSLVRGVMVRCRLIDKGIRRPMLGMVTYAPYDENPLFDQDIYNQFFTRTYSADENGVYTLVALPGPGIVKVITAGGQFLQANVRPDDVEKYPLLGARQSMAHMAVSSLCLGYRMIDPKVGDEPAAFDIELDPGRTIRGSLTDSQGRPIPDFNAYGILGRSHEDSFRLSVNNGGFVVTGLDPDRKQERVILFSDKTRGLAGHLVLRGDETGPLSVPIGRSGTLIGRLVDANDSPLRDTVLRLRVKALPAARLITGSSATSATDHTDWLPPIHTDSDGQFRINGLACSLDHELVRIVTNGDGKTNEVVIMPSLGDRPGRLNLESGEVRVLGTIRVPADRGE